MANTDSYITSLHTVTLCLYTHCNWPEELADKPAWEWFSIQALIHVRTGINTHAYMHSQTCWYTYSAYWRKSKSFFKALFLTQFCLNAAMAEQYPCTVIHHTKDKSTIKDALSCQEKNRTGVSCLMRTVALFLEVVQHVLYTVYRHWLSDADSNSCFWRFCDLCGTLLSRKGKTRVSTNVDCLLFLWVLPHTFCTLYVGVGYLVGALSLFLEVAHSVSSMESHLCWQWNWNWLVRGAFRYSIIVYNEFVLV